MRGGWNRLNGKFVVNDSNLFSYKRCLNLNSLCCFRNKPVMCVDKTYIIQGFAETYGVQR